MKKILIGFLVIISPFSYAQTCNPNIINTAPVSRYELIKNGTEVKDIQTGIIWQRCSLGQTWNGITCIGKSIRYNWVNALQTAKNIGGGWRVPNIKELNSLSEQACYNPSINQTIFPSTEIASYWSSSPVAGRRDVYAWCIDFVSGGTSSDPKSANRYVRLMRFGQ